ncbi:MAG: hypothetical protein ABI553_05155 [Chloroflexota bacterium]
MSADDIETRLAATAARFADLGPRLITAGPWPLAERFDHAPEASWGPPETLAHLEEMLGFWLGQAERVARMADGPERFGRVATDADRLAVIERDRTQPIDELVTAVTAGIERWRESWPGFSEAERQRTGLHPTLGVLRVNDIATRFVASHLQEHLDQLDASVADRPDAG